MLLDTTEFPFVFIDDEKPSSDSLETQVEALLDRGERFVIATDHIHDDEHDHSETHEERKASTLFFKRNKARIRQLCVGAIVIEGATPPRAPKRIAAQAVGKAFGVSFLFVRNKHDAMNEARRLLLRSAT